ncbi:RinA family phage transcriptional regulator [Cohnella kolymensis]|uniref:RinA family phage transcriptional regulator n=1 Tax=Cohnella kolymensis TaxID=1590652 RepID=A0ABR5A528_9BACL|nr:RinA family phage transcriptional regulator [Cohnella kolymensis]KIL35858.1 RinA family phage transcriptional regulator [Cohnella kolymensis]
MLKPKIRKGTFQHVESELYAYHDTRKEIVRLKNEILYATATPDNNGGGRSSLPSDPTGRTATLMVSHRRIEQMERIVEAIESVVDRLPKDKSDMIKMRYWARPQTLTWEGIALNLHISRRQIMNWRDDIIEAITDKIGWR